MPSNVQALIHIFTRKIYRYYMIYSVGYSIHIPLSPNSYTRLLSNCNVTISPGTILATWRQLDNAETLVMNYGLTLLLEARYLVGCTWIMASYYVHSNSLLLTTPFHSSLFKRNDWGTKATFSPCWQTTLREETTQQ
jgi:hypothetical protein